MSFVASSGECLITAAVQGQASLGGSHICCSSQNLKMTDSNVPRSDYSVPVVGVGETE